MAKKILAVAAVTLSKIFDGEQGPPGEVKDFYDGGFSEGVTFWSTAYNNNTKPGSNTKVIKNSEANFGNTLLEIKNELWLYSKNHIQIEKDKIYKFTYRVKQVADSTDSAKSKVYAGATTFDANGNKLCQNNGNYFVTSGTSITVANGWREYTAYISTSTKSAIVNASGQQLCPTVKAFETGTKTIKPMLIVNYAAGDGTVHLDGLMVQDYTQEWNALYAVKDKLNSDFQDVFDALTNGGTIQGIFVQGDKFIFNGEYINARNLRVVDKQDNLTLGIDDSGNVTIRATSLNIGSKPAASKDDVNDAIANLEIGGPNLLSGTRDFFIDANRDRGWQNTDGYTISLDTDDFSIAQKSQSGLTANTIKSIYSSYAPCKKDETYTASVMLKVSDVNAWDIKNPFIFEVYDDSNTRIEYKDVSISDSATNRPTIVNNTWVLFKYTHKITNANAKKCSIRLSLFRNGTIAFKKAKIESGNKVTDWAPSYDELQEAIKNAQDAADNAQTTADGKLTASQLEVFNTLTNGGKDQGIYMNNGLLYLNASYIKAGHIDAKYINTRTFNVTNDEGLVTFGVDSTGDVTIHGTVQSTKFNEDTSFYGYRLTPEGDATFKNAKIGGEFITPEGGISNYGSKNNTKNLVKTSQIAYRDSTGTYNSSKNTWTITSKTGVGTQWGSGVVVTNSNKALIPFGKKYVCSFEIKVPIDCTWNVDVNNSPNSGTAWSGNDNDNTTTRKTSSKTLKANVWTKCWFSYINNSDKNTTKVDLYDLSNFGIINESGKDVVFEMRSIKGEIGEEPTPWVPHESENPKLVRFWAGADYDERTSAPFMVYSDGSIRATRGEFSGVFSGEVSIGNIHIEDTTSSKGAIEIRSNDNTPLIRLNEDTSYFKKDLSIGTSFIEFDSTSKMMSNKGKLQLSNGSISTLLNNGDAIMTTTDSVATHQQQYSNTAYCFRASGSKNRAEDYIFYKSGEDVRVDIWGQFNVRNKISMNGSKVTIVPRDSSGNSGFDFVVN